MNKIDWTQIWLLNELVTCKQLRVSYLLSDPGGDRQWIPNWLFPGHEVLGSTHDARSNLFFEGVRDGLFCLFDEQLEKLDSVSNFSRENLADHDWANQSRASITRKGHELWKSTFEPDWNRFWINTTEKNHEDRQQCVVDVVCASDTMLQELLTWFPAYRGLGRNAECSIIETKKELNYKATQWKVLPEVSVVKIALPLRDPAWSLFSEFKNSLPENLNEREKKRQETIEQFKALSEKLERERVKAKMMLCQFSSSWSCQPRSSNLHDCHAIPIN